MSAALRDQSWRNDRRPSATSPAKSANARAQVVSTLGVYNVSHHPKYQNSTARPNLAITKTITVTIASAVAETSTKLSTAARVSWLTQTEDTGRYVNNIAVAFEGIMSSARGVGDIASSDANSNMSAETGKPVDSASTPDAKNTGAASRAVVDIPGSSIIFLNTSSPEYVLIDYANANVVLWTAPVNKSATNSHSGFRKFIDDINTWLPYVEAFGILAVLWEVGRFVHVKVRRRRGRIARASAVEES